MCPINSLFKKKNLIFFEDQSIIPARFILFSSPLCRDFVSRPSRFALFSDYLRLSEGSGARRSPGSKRKKDISRYIDLIEFLLPWSMPTMLIRPEFPSQISIMKA